MDILCMAHSVLKTTITALLYIMKQTGLMKQGISPSWTADTKKNLPLPRHTTKLSLLSF